MTIDDVKDRIVWFEEEVAEFFIGGGSIDRLHRIELARNDLVEVIETYKGRSPISDETPETDANAEL